MSTKERSDCSESHPGMCFTANTNAIAPCPYVTTANCEDALSQRLVALVSWPAAPRTDSLVRTALTNIGQVELLQSLPIALLPPKLLQWAAYDSIDHSLTATEPSRVLSSAYTIRKALIRKHFLARCIRSYVLKHHQSVLATSVPRTWDIELSFAHELDELWHDELWDLGEELETSPGRWYILKPGMADAGMGIRLFSSKDTLREIFEEFEGRSDDEEAESGDTSVITSQLRHFVIQVFTSHVNAAERFRGHKFHLRTYVVASGALRPYDLPRRGNDKYLLPHLTNTSLQIHRGEEGVRLFDELIGCHILSGSRGDLLLSELDIADIKEQMAWILADVFKAAVEQPVHFQVLPNAFELYGVDFLVSHVQSGSHGAHFQLNILEVNAEPAIELTGRRLTWILEDLFKSIQVVCIAPFVGGVSDQLNSWKVGEVRYNMQKCLDMQVRGGMGW
ncbi:tubulin-tyrosine ligase family-domain-containing protein [Pisolithus orientalis]|uniref:tubulin-tyrosine ligase family-domain-containing protein n=1 Tax=Pisolithus orientalis TaxID=936130 RepID=UPI002225335E|nr:tubulin-tyrosine ligase family-domain-containing protein [Pisolithus orientalis]KAI6005236.1 tubulin-tyrosine ligase family-domain-containing protein [Pisolithus orientalis]